jgi:hypothetical protein
MWSRADIAILITLVKLGRTFLAFFNRNRAVNLYNNCSESQTGCFTTLTCKAGYKLQSLDRHRPWIESYLCHTISNMSRAGGRISRRNRRHLVVCHRLAGHHNLILSLTIEFVPLFIARDNKGLTLPRPAYVMTCLSSEPGSAYLSRRKRLCESP